MATTTVEQEKKMMISPTLNETDSTTGGVYYTQNVWVIDEDTLCPVGTQMNVILSL